MGWIILVVVIWIVAEIVFYTQLISGGKSTWRFYVWTLFTTYTGLWILFGRSPNMISTTVLMIVAGGIVALFLDRAGTRLIRIAKDIIAANRTDTRP